MTYLNKLKEKLKANSTEDRHPFEPFEGSPHRHVCQPRLQPVIVKESKITNTQERFKSIKTPFSRGIAANSATIPAKLALIPAELDSAKLATFRDALIKFKEGRPYSATRFRHDQACWAAEMFLDEWQSLAAEFEWTAADIFAFPRNGCSGLAYWLGVEIVRSLGPEHAVAESWRAFDRTTRQTWINPYQAETKQ